MNIYVFGELSGGYTQYPNDLTSGILRKLYPRARARTQVAIHRDGNLMYYCYIRKLEEKQYLGFCVAMTGSLITDVKGLFGKFEKAIEIAADKGSIIHYDDYGKLTTSLGKLYDESEDVTVLIQKTKELFAPHEENAVKLPPTDFSVSQDSLINYNVNDDNDDIVKSSYTFGYTFIYKEKDYNTVQMNSSIAVISRLTSDNHSLMENNTELKKQLVASKVKQRNIVWVSVLGVVVLILGMILWNKVLFPSEVTNYKTEEYSYYGPMKDGEPNGLGVAVYPADDKDGRRYYVGNFVNGKRQDDKGLLLWKNGNYYYGKLHDETFIKGIFWSNVQKTHYIGSFIDDNKEYNGVWYDHKILKKVVNGN